MGSTGSDHAAVLPEPSVEVKGPFSDLRSLEQRGQCPQEQVRVLGGWHWEGPVYVKSTLCPGMGKGKEKCDDCRSEDERRSGKIRRQY